VVIELAALGQLVLVKQRQQKLLRYKAVVQKAHSSP
jgi:hypothetical protein